MTMHLIVLLLLVSFVVVISAKPCEILENMICECHSSSINGNEQLFCTTHNNSLTTIKITNETMQTIRTFTSFHLTFQVREFNVSAMFINELTYLFPRSTLSSEDNLLPFRSNNNVAIKITLSFQDFNQLHFEDYAFYQLFSEEQNQKTSFNLELTSNGEITFAPLAFSQLIVDQMTLHSSSLEAYSFEEIFNQTKIGDLIIEGFTPKSNETLKTYFTGKIRSAKFTKMAEMLSSEEFPEYPVRAMTIEVHEPRRMNATTFINYRNLNGLNIIRPKFSLDNSSFNGLQYSSSLETIELDAETIKDNTFMHASRIRFLSFGANTRYLSERALNHLDYLTRLDLSKLLLDQLYPLSRCVLARYLNRQQKSNPSMIVLPPISEHCDCIYDFILNILNKKHETTYMELCRDTQQERCQISECDVVKNFRSPSFINRNTVQPSEVVESIVDGPLPFARVTTTTTTISDHQSPAYVHRHPARFDNPSTFNEDENPTGSSHIGAQVIVIQPSQSSLTPRSYFVDSHTSALKSDKPIDPNAIPTDDNNEENFNPSLIIGQQINPSNRNTISSDDEQQRRIRMKNETLKWISLSLVCITILSLLLVSTIIWFFTCRKSKTPSGAGFKLVPSNSSNV